MPRRPQKPATKGSQFWTQELVNRYPDVLEDAIDARPIIWSSPLRADEYAEYWDQSFLDTLHVKLDKYPLNAFWPRSGPRWDAIGQVAGGAAVLLEAKSHIPEMMSACRATPLARAQIEKAFGEVARGWGVTVSAAWLKGYYQYANRLAHAFLLNEVNAVPTFVVFLHIVGDHTMRHPATIDAWKAAIDTAHDALGVRNKLPPYIVDAFIDVSGSSPVAA